MAFSHVVAVRFRIKLSICLQSGWSWPILSGDPSVECACTGTHLPCHKHRSHRPPHHATAPPAPPGQRVMGFLLPFGLVRLSRLLHEGNMSRPLIGTLPTPRTPTTQSIETEIRSSNGRTVSSIFFHPSRVEGIGVRICFSNLVTLGGRGGQGSIRSPSGLRFWLGEGPDPPGSRWYERGSRPPRC